MKKHHLNNSKNIIVLLLLALLTFFVPTITQAAQVDFTWDANPGAENVLGYKLYFGKKTSCNSSCVFTGNSSTQGSSPIDITIGDLNDPDNPSYILDGLDEGEWCSRLTAYNNIGESGFTATISKVIDTVDPAISITAPATSPFSTTSSSLDINGSASDNQCLESVTWENDRGGSGTATGTASWSQSNIALQLGDNEITVTVNDSAGNTTTETITVSYNICTDADGDGFCIADDCDDSNSSIYPGATETCDGEDNDCNGQTDEGLTQQSCGSSVGACQSGTQTCSAGSWGTCVGEIGPSAETCDGVDNDCDGQTDEGLTLICGSSVGACQSGTQTCSAGSWGTCVGEIGPSAETCDGADNDCDGQVDEGMGSAFYIDTDSDGYGDPAVTTVACNLPAGYAADNTDCDDGNTAINPGATETCDGTDNDCDGQTDESLTQNCGSSVGECQSGTQTCSAGSWGTCVGEVGPSTETCDGVDNDCDGQVDEGVGSTFYIDTDSDGYGDPAVTTVACNPPTGYLADNTDCDDEDTAINPGATDICDDDIDNDCDGQTDERCNPPAFSVNINLNASPIEICFTPDQSLDTDPIVTLVTGNGTMDPVSGSMVSPVDDPCSDIPNMYTYCVDYTVDSGDTVVEIHLDEDPNDLIIIGDPGFEIAYFVIDADHEIASSFYIYNDDGGTGFMRDDQCNGAAVIETDPLTFDYSGSGLNSTDYFLVELADVDPTGIPEVDNTRVTDVLDIILSDGVRIADGRTMTITLSFVLPNGWTQQEFIDNLQVLYYDESLGIWSPYGISNVSIDFDATTITFETTHLSIFAASSKASAGTTGSSSSGGGGGGGCSVVPANYSMSISSAVANSLILLLPLIICGTRRKKGITNSKIRK